ncbi:hypothetical protein [Aquimarina sediminis]|uniref:hypothetical protein n=1 Tax=Aquimarina sediminis TaxID=2070536 RepID=UPI000FFF21F1|nr:hypothetical protein [Aquimarina sediminis]
MKKTDFTYLFFYISFLAVICAVLFFDKWVLVYVKPIVPLSLVFIYLKHAKKPAFLFVVCMLLIIVTDIFISLDFAKYYTVIALLISLFYVLCILLLKRFISKGDVNLKTLLAVPVILSTVLIGYLVFSIVDLILPKMTNSIGSMILIIVSLLMFVVVCFFVYVADKYEKLIYLFIAACCTLFVDALLPINELYYYSTVFTVLINITEILGIFLFTVFFIETKPKNKKEFDDKYF